MPVAGPTRVTRAAQRKRPAPSRLAKPAPRPVRAPLAARQYQSQARDVASRSRPTTTNRQLRQAKAQGRQYASQGRAVRRQAKIQKAVGPGHAVKLKRHDPILHVADVERYQRKPSTQARFREAAYRSQGADVEKRAKQQEKAAKYVMGKHGVKIPKEYLETDKLKQQAAGFAPEGMLDRVIKQPGKFIANAGKDAEEIVKTTPSSIAHLAVTQGEAVVKSAKTGSPVPLLKANYKLGKDTVNQYVEAAKRPDKAIFERPFTTALMFAPGAKIPKLAAGRAARTVGKQTLERPDAVLPGTTLRVKRVGSRDVVKRAKQTHKDKQGVPALRVPEPTPDLPPGGKGSPKRVVAKARAVRQTTEIDRRVDEFYDWGQQHKQAQQGSTIKQAKKMAGGRRGRRKRLRDPELRTKIEEKMTGGAAGGQQHVEREFAREFGSHWQVVETPGGKPIVVKPKNAPESSGHIHATKAEADKIAEAITKDPKVNWTPRVIELEGQTAGKTSGFAVVPEAVAQRYRHHKAVGTAPATGAVLLREGSRAFRKTVLPYSPKWLLGQAVEGMVRAAAAGAGPTSLVRYHRLIRELKRIDKAQGTSHAKQLEARAVSGGYSGTTGPLAELVGKGSTLAHEFKDTGLKGPAELATEVGALPGVRHARGINRRATQFVFKDLNGAIEKLAKQAMLGKAVKQGHLMERSVVDLSGKATREAAQGLKGTANQVQLARAVDRMYGKYSKYGPHAREMIAHTTPFFPWFRNMGEFLLKVLPQDHPAKASLLAAYTEADREWRERNRLSVRGKSQVPPFMLGSYAKSKDKFAPAGRFMPFLPGEPVKELGGQAIPQFIGTIQNTQGVDWKGNKIKTAKGEDARDADLAANAALTALETFVPLTSQADRVTGLGDYYVRNMRKKPSVVQGKSVKRGVLDLINPVKEVGLEERSKRAKRKAKRKGGFGSGGGGRSGFGGGGSGGGFRG